LRRLSSGLRINSAADDAAGLAISQRLTAQVRGLDQGARNANDAVSVTQTADSGLASIATLLQRVRELAVQAANGANGAADRQALDGESSQLIQEAQRIVGQTRLNGSNLLDGSFANRDLQLGAAVADSIRVDIADASLNSTPTYTYNGTAPVDNNGITAGSLTFDVGGGPVAIVPSVPAGNWDTYDYEADAKANAINASGVPGVTATATNTQVFTPMSGPGITAGVNDALQKPANLQPGDAYNWDFQINLYTIYSGAWVDMSVATLAGLINAQQATTGVSASLTGSGQLQLDKAGGGTISLYETWPVNDAVDGAGKPGLMLGSMFTSPSPVNVADGINTTYSNTQHFNGTVTIKSAHAITFGGSANAGALFGESGTPVLSYGLANANLLTRQGALDTITSVDQMLDKLSTSRAALGALGNRLASAARNAGAASQNASAARGRISDADFASETAAMSRSMILHAAGAAMTVQANAESRVVLALLRGLI
jgi:flagellin